MLDGSANGLGVLQDAHIKFLIGEVIGRKIDLPSGRSPPRAISGGLWLVAYVVSLFRRLSTENG